MDINEFKKTYEHKKVVENDNQVTQHPTVSVCIQTYQHVNYIKECLDSILNQKTDFDYEILLGEDASTDGTREICLKYAEKYPDKIRLFLHHRENNIKIGGQPTGRFNFLHNLYTAQGKYIALCEGDDYWTDPLKLQKQVDFLEANEEYVMCFHRCRFLSVVDGKKRLREQSLVAINYDYNLENLLSYWNIPTASIVFRRQDSIMPNEFLNVASGDIALAAYMYQFGDFHLIKDVMSVYRTGIGVSLLHKQFQMIDYRVDLYFKISRYYNGKYQKEIYTALFYVMQRYAPILQTSNKDLTFKQLISRLKRKLIKKIRIWK